MRRLLGLFLIVLLFCIILASTPEVEASGYYGGYRYSPYYQYGYSYYGASYSNGYYWPSGYYYTPQSYYYPPPVTIYQPYIAYTPVAVSTYVPAQAVPAVQLNNTADPCAGHLKKFEQRMELLEKENASMKKLLVSPTPQSQPQQVPQPSQPEPQYPPSQPNPNGSQQQQPTRQVHAAPLSGLVALTNRCAKCHDSSIDVKEYGGGFTLFNDGKMVALTAEQLVKMDRKIKRGEMPPQKLGEQPLSQEEGTAIMDYLTRVKVAAK